MARSVREIMNPELLSIASGSPADETLELILEFGITAVPVLADDGRPVGVSSLRDVVGAGSGPAPMSTPASTIDVGASVSDAADVMARTGRHHLVVVASDGRAVGMVSTLDVLRALIGQPVKHPPAFPGYDMNLDATWSADEAFDEPAIAAAPEVPGVVVVLTGGAGRDEATVWADATKDIRALVKQLVVTRTTEAVELSPCLRGEALRLRWSIVPDAPRRGALARRLRDRIAGAPPPGAS